MSDIVIIGLLTLGCIFGGIVISYLDHKIIKLEKEIAVLKTKLEMK